MDETLVALFARASALTERGELDEADRILEERVAHAERIEDPCAVASALHALAYHRIQVRRVDAKALVVRLREHVMSRGAIRHDFEILVVMLEQAIAFEHGSEAEQEKAILAEIDAMRRATGAQHTDYAIALKRLGEHYLAWSRLDRAEPVLSRALTIVELRNPESENVGWFLLPLVDFALARGRLDAAAQHLDRIEHVWRFKYDAPRREIASRRERITNLAVTRLRHPKLGAGTVVERDGDKVRLKMDDGAERVFLMDRLVPG
jgi:tetratricopeptide (TPR) repeat protein